MVPAGERGELGLRAAHADVRGLVGDPGSCVFCAGLPACLGQQVLDALLQMADPLLPLRQGGCGNHKGLLGGFNHPAVLHLQGVWQRLQSDIFEGDDVLGIVLSFVDDYAAVDEDVIEKEKYARLWFLAAFFG